MNILRKNILLPVILMINIILQLAFSLFIPNQYVAYALICFTVSVNTLLLCSVNMAFGFISIVLSATCLYTGFISNIFFTLNFFIAGIILILIFVLFIKSNSSKLLGAAVSLIFQFCSLKYISEFLIKLFTSEENADLFASLNNIPILAVILPELIVFTLAIPALSIFLKYEYSNSNE